MDRFDMLALLEEGLANGRISPQTAAFIAADLLGVEAYETGYHEWDGLVEAEPLGALRMQVSAELVETN